MHLAKEPTFLKDEFEAIQQHPSIAGKITMSNLIKAFHFERCLFDSGKVVFLSND